MGKQDAFAAWNSTTRDYPIDQCLHQLVEQQVSRTPEAVAVVFGGQALSYRELNARANQLAHHLRALGVGPDSLVGVCAERSLEMVVGLLGTLKAGGAYVPLDPEYPKDRLAFMMQDADVPVLLTQERLTASLPAHQPALSGRRTPPLSSTPRVPRESRRASASRISVFSISQQPRSNASRSRPMPTFFSSHRRASTPQSRRSRPY
jgi:non-ribosomal peptide synthetase component F